MAILKALFSFVAGVFIVIVSLFFSVGIPLMIIAALIKYLFS